MSGTVNMNADRVRAVRAALSGMNFRVAPTYEDVIMMIEVALNHRPEITGTPDISGLSGMNQPAMQQTLNQAAQLQNAVDVKAAQIKAEADMKAKADADAKAKSDADAKAKADIKVDTKTDTKA